MPLLQVQLNTRFTDFSLTAGTGSDSSQQSWLKRFVSDLALTRDAVNPNANIRVSLPANVENGQRLRTPVSLL